MRKSFRNLMNDAAVFAAGNMLTKLIQFFLLPMYTALLTADQYGVGELVNNLSELLYPLCCLGIYESVFRFSLDRDSDRGAVFSTGMVLALLLVPVVVVAGVLGVSFMDFDYTWQLVALCLATSLKTICLQFARGLGKTKLYAASGVVGALVLCGSGFILLGVLRAGVHGYLMALLLSQVVQLVLVAVGAKIWRYFSPARVSRQLMSRLLRYSLPMIPNTLAWWLVNLSGRYIVLFVQGPTAAGLYTAASKLPAVMNMIVSVLQQAWQIFSAKEYGSVDKRESFGIVFRVYSSLLLCVGSVAIAITEPLARIMLGGEFYDARFFVPLLMFGAIINGYSMYFGTLYNAAKQNGMIFVTTAIGAAANVAVGVFLVTPLGAWGPVVGAVVAYSLISLIRMLNTRRFVVIEVDVLYQVVGFCSLLTESVLLSVGAPFATLAAVGISLIFIVFSMIRYQELLVRILSALLGRKR